jgi:hypothetical protein
MKSMDLKEKSSLVILGLVSKKIKENLEELNEEYY